MKYTRSLFLLLIISSPCHSEEIVINSVVASVDGKPITLSDLGSQLSPPRKLTLQQAAADAEARRLLEKLIFERVLAAEAEERKVQVDPSEIEQYIDEVAAKNNLSRPDFEAALAQRGTPLDQYREQIRLEILKSRLAGTFVRGSSAVTEEEVDAYVGERDSTPSGVAKMKLRQIFLSSERHSDEEARATLEKIRSDQPDTEEFAHLARTISESPERSEGGLLGVMAEKDLNPEILDAVLSLDAGEISQVVHSSSGYQLFFVEQRYSDDDDAGDKASDDELRKEARQVLESRKVAEKMQSFFTEELFKRHAVDKKI